MTNGRDRAGRREIKVIDLNRIKLEFPVDVEERSSATDSLHGSRGCNEERICNHRNDFRNLKCDAGEVS